MTINKPEKQGKWWEREVKKIIMSYGSYDHQHCSSECTKRWYEDKNIRDEVDEIMTLLSQFKSETIQSVLACRPEKLKGSINGKNIGDNCAHNHALDDWTKAIKELI